MGRHPRDGRPAVLGTTPTATGTLARRPDEPLTAWRYWRVDAAGRLVSVSQRGFTWQPGVPLRAGCVGGGHPAPDPGCNCGIHGSPDLAALRDHALCLAPGELVIGEVGLWGRVVHDDHGYRGEYASPRRLWLVTDAGNGGEVLRALGAYGVPVATMAAAEALGAASAATMAFLAMSGPAG